LNALVPTRQLERVLMPTMIINHQGDGHLGSLDGVYCVGGTGLSAETTVTLGARTFRALQNIQRNSGNDFFLVEEL
jgi:hypothetical protein